MEAKVSRLKHLTEAASHHRRSMKKVVLRNFTNFRGKHLCQIQLLIKLQFTIHEKSGGTE